MDEIIYHEDSLEFEGSKIMDITPVNSTISKAKIYVMYTGNGNAKKMHFSREVIEAAIPSAFDMPVRALYDEDAVDAFGQDGDYGGHETKYDSNRGKIIRGTHPLGVIPESAEYGFEVDSEGKEWFWIECYLWKTCVAYEKIEELTSAFQSTEIGNIEYKLDQNRSVVVKSFEFQGFCILGTKRTPAFDKSTISLMFENSNEFLAEFEALKATVKELIERTKGMDLSNQNVITTNFSDQQFEAGVPIVEETVDTPVEQSESFEIDVESMQELLYGELHRIKKLHGTENEYSWIVTFSNSMLIFKESDITYGCGYTFDGTNITVDYENKKKVYRDWRYLEESSATPPVFFDVKNPTEQNKIETFEDENTDENTEGVSNTDGDIDRLNGELEDKGRQINELMNENSALKKRIASDIVSKYESVLNGNEQFETLKKSIDTVEDVDLFEKDIKCAYADMELQRHASTPSNSSSMVEAAIGVTKQAPRNARYGNLINKHGKNKGNDE